jgi:sporulation protein YlmC with PRC-barrel domain
MVTTIQPMVLSASTMIDDEVCNPAGESLGKIEELMIDVTAGRIAYAVLSFGGFLGLGNKLFAIPWMMLSVNADEHTFILDVDRERLQDAPGFDKDDWPLTSDKEWLNEVYRFYGYETYWS